MSRNIFFFIFANLSSDDAETRAVRWKQDRFAAARELLELLNEQCLKCLSAYNYLYIDETLCPTRSQISFKQFNPSKQAKYGLLFKSINSVRYTYTFVTAPYVGKPQNEGGQFYHPGTENVTKYLIERMDGKKKKQKSVTYLSTDCTHRLRLRHGILMKSMSMKRRT